MMMRWTHKPEYMPRPGEQRIVERFLWWPVRIENETRWLEKVRIQQEAKKKLVWVGKSGRIYGVGWENIQWLLT